MNSRVCSNYFRNVYTSGMRLICSMKGLGRANMGWVYCLHMQIYCSRGPGADNTCGGRGFQDDTVSHGGSTRQDGLTCSRSPHTRRSWSASGGRRTADGRRGSSSCATPESIAAWRPSRRAHTCKGGYLPRIQSRGEALEAHTINMQTKAGGCK